MPGKTKIEWTDAVWNPVSGCDRISSGCDHCYALTQARRLKAMGAPRYQNDGDPRTSGPGFAVTLHPDSLDQPLRWRTPKKIFVNSMSDLFHDDVPAEFIAEVFARMAFAHWHTFQVLTKRPQRMARLLDEHGFNSLREDAIDRLIDSGEMVRFTNGGNEPDLFQWPLPNVWLGTSIEDDRYSFRADHLRRTNAAVRFVSAEPLLGPLPSLNLTGIDWVIAGGESGTNARPMHPYWVTGLRDRCTAARVPFLFKQWGEWAPGFDRAQRMVIIDDLGNERRTAELPLIGTAHLASMIRVGKHQAGRTLEHRLWDEYPGHYEQETP